MSVEALLKALKIQMQLQQQLQVTDEPRAPLG